MSKTVIPKGNEKILFVDDEQMIVHFAEKILTQPGYEVEVYDDSQTALEAFL